MAVPLRVSQPVRGISSGMMVGIKFISYHHWPDQRWKCWKGKLPGSRTNLILDARQTDWLTDPPNAVLLSSCSRRSEGEYLPSAYPLISHYSPPFSLADPINHWWLASSPDRIGNSRPFHTRSAPIFFAPTQLFPSLIPTHMDGV